ncbi:MAG: hypothetical protein RL136_586 [Planctomycetota bacterium]|jgi:hypothetical protein
MSESTAGSQPTTPDASSVAPPAPTLAEEIRRQRTAALVVFLATTGLLSVAWSLEPSQRGFGTHQALGLPACSWPARFGLPCPSCGMTTAFAFAAKGRFVESFVTQPMGFLLAIMAGMTLVGSAWTVVTGHSLWPVYERLWNARTAWFLGIAALLAWGYKIAAMQGWLG